MTTDIHILFLDPLEKLSLKKDSTLQLALTLKERGSQVYLLFEEDFFFQNKGQGRLKVYDFEGQFEEDGCYLKSFLQKESHTLKITPEMILHMRIDPPLDSRYLRYLWMLRALKEKFGVRVINDPVAIAAHNEKMVCYEGEDSVATYVGSSQESFLSFYRELKEQSDYSGLILKPLDLFQGIGVEKIDSTIEEEEVLGLFKKKLQTYEGPVVAQPFLKAVYSGEIRALYFNGKEIGSIIKTPPEGQFLANIAQGAKFEAVTLEEEVAKKCREMSLEFAQKGVPWIAYDILGSSIQEANLTCPGLLVEVSKAHKRNLAETIVVELEEYLKKL